MLSLINWMECIDRPSEGNCERLFLFLCRLAQVAPSMIGGIKLLAHIDPPAAKGKKLSVGVVCSCLAGRPFEGTLTRTGTPQHSGANVQRRRLNASKQHVESRTG